jgi:trimethylamine--corrinoid protein Co-methyltransferase
MEKSTEPKNFLEQIRLPRLSDIQCKKIHETSLDIIERVGVRLDLQEGIDLLKKAGARVDEKNLVHVPFHLVEKALKTAPKKIDLFDREGNPSMPVQNNNCFYGPGSDCLNIIDHRNGKRRRPVLNDIKEGIILCDSLTNIDFVMSMLLPSDVDSSIADRYQMEIMLSYTTKPVIFVAYGFGGCQDAVKMAEIMAGGEQSLQEKPNIACYINVISGLVHNQESLQKLLFLASKNLPAIYVPSSTAGVTSPITPAGALALDYAGVLVGLVLSQLKREGAPVFIPGMPPGQLDLRTMISTYCEPERGLAPALAHFYGLPMFSLGGASESKLIDQQAAAEAALSLLAETMNGGNIIHDLGYLESGLTFSFAQLSICNEIVDWIKGYGREADLSDESIGLDLICEIGPEGQYLNTDHTLKHFRDRWYPKLFDRDTYDGWLRKKGRSLVESAVEMVETTLAEHSPDMLPGKIREKLRKIVQNAEK